MNTEEKRDVCVIHVTSPLPQSSLLLSWHVLMYIQISQYSNTGYTESPESRRHCPAQSASIIWKPMASWVFITTEFWGITPKLGELHNIYVGLSSSSKSTCMLHTLSLPSSWCSGPLTSKLQEENYTTAGPKNTRPASPVGIRGKIRSHPDTEERTELRVHSRASSHKAEANFLGKGPVGIA